MNWMLHLCERITHFLSFNLIFKYRVFQSESHDYIMHGSALKDSWCLMWNVVLSLGSMETCVEPSLSLTSPSVRLLRNIVIIITLPPVGHVTINAHGLPSKPKMASFPSSKVPGSQVILHGLVCEGNANKEQTAFSFRSLHGFINTNKLWKRSSLHFGNMLWVAQSLKKNFLVS